MRNDLPFRHKCGARVNQGLTMKDMDGTWLGNNLVFFFDSSYLA